MKSFIFVFFLSFSQVFAASTPKQLVPGTPTSPPKLSLSRKKANPIPFKPSDANEKHIPRTGDPKAIEVIENYLKATGGRKAYKNIETRYEKFNVLRHSPTGITKALFERYMKAPNMVREQWNLNLKVADQNLNVLQIYNGKTNKGWTKMMGYVDELKGKMIPQLMHDKVLDEFFLHWKNDGYSLVYRGDGEVESKKCDVVDVYHPTSKQRLRFFFSKDNHLKLKKQWRSDTRNGPVRNQLLFLEWRKVKDMKNPKSWIIVPFKKERFEEGDLVMEREYLEVKINSDLGDELFQRPKGPIYDKKKIDQVNKTTKKKKEKKLPPWMIRKKRKTNPGTATQPKEKKAAEKKTDK